MDYVMRHLLQPLPCFLLVRTLAGELDLTWGANAMRGGGPGIAESGCEVFSKWWVEVTDAGLGGGLVSSTSYLI